MRRLALLLAVALGLSAGCAEAAGLQEISVPAKGESPAITGVVWTPCAEPAGEVKLGTATLQATANCPILGDKLPLVIISHGYGGNALGHRDTAQALVEAGFVVVAISHPIDSGRGDMGAPTRFQSSSSARPTSSAASISCSALGRAATSSIPPALASSASRAVAIPASWSRAVIRISARQAPSATYLSRSRAVTR